MILLSYSHLLHFPSFFCTTIHSSPFQLLFLPLVIHSFPSSTPLWPSPNLSPHYLSLLHTYHLLTSLEYKLYTTPALCNPWHKHPPLLQQKYTQTHTRVTKPSSPIPLNPPTHPFSCSPYFSTTFTNSPKSIMNLMTITSPTPTVYRYYHQGGGFYIICKQLIWNWTCEFVIDKLHFQTRNR
jgi:hypothetical protein